MNYQYGTEARRLLDLDANQWTFSDLDSCGKLLMQPQEISNEERGELKKKLVIDPRIVQEVLGMTQAGTKGRKTGVNHRGQEEDEYESESDGRAIRNDEYEDNAIDGADWCGEAYDDEDDALAYAGNEDGEGELSDADDTAHPDSGLNDSAASEDILSTSIREDGKKIYTARDPETNTVLCINTAGAFLHNRKFYMPLQRQDPDTICDFSVLAWEYLQTKAFARRQNRERFSMQKLLFTAARPNGWIGANPVFRSADTRHKKNVEEGHLSHYLIDSGLSIDHVDGNGQSVLDQYPESVFSAAADFTGRIEADDTIRLIKKRMQKRNIPVEEVELYIAVCLLEGRPLHAPSGSIRDFVRDRMRAYGKCWDDTKIRLWFHRCYKAFTKAAAKEYRYYK